MDESANPLPGRGVFEHLVQIGFENQLLTRLTAAAPEALYITTGDDGERRHLHREPTTTSEVLPPMRNLRRMRNAPIFPSFRAQQRGTQCVRAYVRREHYTDRGSRRAGEMGRFPIDRPATPVPVSGETQ